MKRIHSAFAATVSCAIAASLSGGTAHAANGGCQLQSPQGQIKHVFYLQFDNVHFRRDNPRVPSDLEQMPHLLDVLTSQGTLLNTHWTPLISHTSVNILTSLSGLYGDRMGIPIGNSLRYYNPDGTTNGMSSFAYWTDPVAAFAGQPITDTTPQMIGEDGKTAPAPWAVFTRAGCDVGAFSIANLELENIGIDITTVFGAGSPEAQEAASDSAKAQADFLGIAVHCAQGSPLCANGKPDLLPDEPGGYAGFNALFGNKNVQPAISPGGPVKDLDGNVIQDSHGNPGFPNLFNPSASQTLGYAATMFEAGVPVVYTYISDAHDNHFTGSGTFGPGEAGYEQQLHDYDTAFGTFFARLAADNITTANTLFIVTADENDHFVGSAPSPATCDGVTTPCTYAHIGEINGDLSRLVASQRSDTTPFTVHSDSAPAVYITGNPAQTSQTARRLETDFAKLTAVNPITGKIDKLTAALADHAEQNFLHMVTADAARTPTFIMFADENYFLFASGQTTNCAQGASCITEPPGFAWNHGDFQDDITNTWLAMVGPGVKHRGVVNTGFSDHTDIRPTLISLVGLQDDYEHDGRVLFENLDQLPPAITQHRATFQRLVTAYKMINAPKGTLGRVTLGLSTLALSGNATTYATLEAKIARVTAQRDAIAGKMIAMIEGAEFDGVPIDEREADKLIAQANALLAAPAS
ncbi:MAG TPA: hypothetical protein VMQ73_00640 [Methylomirabilota bacterium]|nr:hypothetical protein [Methylomirabilota bacterium]